MLKPVRVTLHQPSRHAAIRRASSRVSSLAAPEGIHAFSPPGASQRDGAGRTSGADEAGLNCAVLRRGFALFNGAVW